MKFAMSAALIASSIALPAFAQEATKMTCPRDIQCALWCYAGVPKPENTVIRRGSVKDVTWNTNTQVLEYTTNNSQNNQSGIALLRNNETCVFDLMTRSP